MQLQAETKLHNKFKFILTNSLTGEVKQEGFAENIVLSRTLARFASNTSLNIMSAIHIGSGTGILDPSRLSLFQYVRGLGAVADSVTYHDTYAERTVRGEILPGTDTGVIYTEVGLATHTSNAGNDFLATHALIKDVEGNPIGIEKGPLDVLTVYATVFAELGSISGPFASAISWVKPENNDSINMMLGLSSRGSSLSISAVAAPKDVVEQAFWYTLGARPSMSASVSGVTRNFSAQLQIGDFNQPLRSAVIANTFIVDILAIEDLGYRVLEENIITTESKRHLKLKWDRNKTKSVIVRKNGEVVPASAYTVKDTAEVFCKSTHTSTDQTVFSAVLDPVAERVAVIPGSSSISASYIPITSNSTTIGFSGDEEAFKGVRTLMYNQYGTDISPNLRLFVGVSGSTFNIIELDPTDMAPLSSQNWLKGDKFRSFDYRSRIWFSPDSQWLYVCQYSSRNTYKYEVDWENKVIGNTEAVQLAPPNIEWNGHYSRPFYNSDLPNVLAVASLLIKFEPGTGDILGYLYLTQMQHGTVKKITATHVYLGQLHVLPFDPITMTVGTPYTLDPIIDRAASDYGGLWAVSPDGKFGIGNVGGTQAATRRAYMLLFNHAESYIQALPLKGNAGVETDFPVLGARADVSSTAAVGKVMAIAYRDYLSNNWRGAGAFFELYWGDDICDIVLNDTPLETDRITVEYTPNVLPKDATRIMTITSSISYGGV